MEINIIDHAAGKPRVLSEQCATCVGRPGNIADLRAGRLRELVRENTGDGKMGLVCHSTIDYSQPDGGDRQAICRWFYDTFGHLANGIRVMQRIGGFLEVPPPEVDFGSADPG
jgi:hypothetical protein